LWVFPALAARRAIKVTLGMVLVGLLFLARRAIRVIRASAARRAIRAMLALRVGTVLTVLAGRRAMLALRVGTVLTVLAGRRAMLALRVGTVLTAKTVLLMSIRWRLSTFSMMTLRFWLLIRFRGLLTGR
jgi:hypothetical protein